MKSWKKYLLFIFLIFLNKNTIANNIFLDEKYFYSQFNKYREKLLSDLSDKKLKIESKHYSKFSNLLNPNIKIEHDNTVFISTTRDKELIYSDNYIINYDEMILYRENKLNFFEKNIIIEANHLNIEKNASIICKNFLFVGNSISLKKYSGIYISGNFVSLGSVTLQYDSGIYRIMENDDDYDDEVEKKSKFILHGNLSYFSEENGRYPTNMEIMKDETEFSKYIMFSRKKNQILIK